MAKDKTKFVCLECGFETVKWLGRCSDCGAYNSFVEEKVFSEPKNKKAKVLDQDVKNALVLSNIEIKTEDRISTGIEEMDRVFGEGIVKGSLVLIGGEPGIGKSTLLLQISDLIAKRNIPVLYVTGEESVSQIKLRADRLKVSSDAIRVLPETSIERVIEVIKKEEPEFLIVDSIQTIYSEELTSVPGSVSQVREITNILMNISKNMGITTIIIGHVTKDGSIAGPKVLEHMVDTVLYFEGERLNTNRIIRTVKNRFGSTNEIGVFDMTSEGLKEVTEPSKVLVQSKTEASGSVITCAVEGTRPILLEVQALVTRTNMAMARRTAIGIDYNRLSLLIAIIEKHVGLDLSTYDVYVNIVGGFRINDTATDLAIIAAIISSFRNKVIPGDMGIFGEVGLLGEIRSVVNYESRIKELKKMGFKKGITPVYDIIDKKLTGIEISGINNIKKIKEFI